MLSPLRLIVVLILLWLVARRWLPRSARMLLLVPGCILVLLTTPLGANFLVRIQESRAPGALECAGPEPTTIVLLSGGLTRVPRNGTDYAALNAASLDRLFAAVDLYRRLPAAQLVIVGTSGHAFADSDIMASLARRLGVADTALRVEDRSLTTWENAYETARLVPPLPQRIWLVTSALHMARAFMTFDRAGFVPCAWASHSDYIAVDGWGYFVPLGTAAVKSEQALHEMAGEFVYRLRRGPGTAGAALPKP